ncbi:hypothetical protein KP509_05G037600 [Ceratopteris richardii]|uniref:Protein ROOT HAIR DEFECTIVE 3 homolog n=1 Tax=Ceratopteris richardii TaxID=49495 RepID=A0A8T2UT97_CERRI|nr:hypothetical protein KP509_05G037600 [Ceratopteris richardii]KAH7436830.1 hypothetical protein KP509_05G037600 [Ceratopteris richardii]KAH7436831.1 hypothetical protein KP509_05G037600 [Ceratopteris richardii]KAH7436832.1 hypothetical protein KP509_05G037600 [Ceratopteris richardii]KAH7436833.1 hypothetical protein KP509_05G037600 [Ceratopteris richardii]
MDEESSPSVQLVDGEGNFNEIGLEAYVKTVRLREAGLSYAVVSIMGPQSSGKSTLLNHLFGTNFREMDALKGRSQTTQGIWLAKAKSIRPLTLIMDLEGTDGRERGEDETTFEKQSALFALAVSDIVLINMWCHDIGREQAANKPLLKTVFQVMMRLFTPRKSTLLFVIRDKTKTPLEVLERILREDVQKIWNTVAKPAKHLNTPISEFFNVEVTALSSYEEKEEQFLDQVSNLRERFMDSICPGGLAGDRRAVVPGSGFPFSTQEIWKVIKENKDLDLPAHKVMVATVRCEEIANEKLRELHEDEDWRTLESDSTNAIIPGFGKKLNNVLSRHLARYDTEAAFFDEGVRTSKRQVLLKKTLEVLYPSYQAMLTHHRSKAFERFKNGLESHELDDKGFAAKVRYCSDSSLGEFDQGAADAFVEIANWHAGKVRDKLSRDIEMHAISIQTEKLAAISSEFEKRLENGLGDPVSSLLEGAKSNIWPAIKELLAQELQSVTADLSAVLAGFELTKEEEQRYIINIRKSGKKIIEKKAREEANQALVRLKERFNQVFTYGPDSLPRVWTGKEDIKSITKNARLQSLRLLSVLTALRLEEMNYDCIDDALSSLEINEDDSASEGEIVPRTVGSSVLASSTWEGIPASETLITPVQCRGLWRQFNREIEYTISQAIAAQEASRRSNSWLPPPWAIVAMIFLGFNEFMMLLRNPLYLVVLFVLFLLGRAVWVQLDIEREFQHGFLAGALSVSAKLLPTFMNFLKKLAEEGQQMANSANGSNISSITSGNYTRTAAYKQAPMQEMTSFSGSTEERYGNGEKTLSYRKSAKFSS